MRFVRFTKQEHSEDRCADRADPGYTAYAVPSGSVRTANPGSVTLATRSARSLSTGFVSLLRFG